MKRTFTILGTLLIAAVFIISGSAVAAMVWVTYVYDVDCTNPTDIAGIPDQKAATIGKNPSTLGYIVVDMGSGNEMPNSQNFSVFGLSGEAEDYTVWVSETHLRFEDYVGSGTDDTTEIFITPSSGGNAWRYILICGTSGATPTVPDPYWGPEINAVGWDKP